MKKYIIVEADYNDGDIVEEKSLIDNGQINKLRKILSRIDYKKGPNGQVYSSIQWRVGDYASATLQQQHPELSNHEINFLNNFCPSAECRIHTIESIEIITVIEEEKLV